MRSVWCAITSTAYYNESYQPVNSTSVGIRPLHPAKSGAGSRAHVSLAYTALWIWYAAIAAIRLRQFEIALKHAEAGILIKPDVATGHLLRAIACRGLLRCADGEASLQDAIAWSQSLSLTRMPRFMPYRDAADLERALEALRELGMPS